jgi:hypothetical protein
MTLEFDTSLVGEQTIRVLGEALGVWMPRVV